MHEDIVIERMHLSDRDAALEFLARAYPDNPRQSDQAFWNWHFLEHPVGGDGSPHIWLAKSGSRIAGQLACIPVRLRLRGETVPSTWILDLMVDPDFRRRGIMKNLVREIHKLYPVVLGVNTNQQHAPAMLKSIGWNVVGLIPRYHKLLYPGNDIKQIQSSGPLATLVNVISAPLRPKMQPPSPNIRRLSGFDASFEALWVKSAAQWDCVVERTPATLDWQYIRQPGKRFDIIGSYRGEGLAGYAVMFFRAGSNGKISKAAISDICYAPDESSEVIDELLTECVRLALERRCGGVVIDVMDARVESGVQKAGFWKINSPLQLMVWSADPNPVVAAPSSWFLTRGDSDISIFEHPNVA